MSTSAASEVSLSDLNLLESGGIVAFVTPGGLGFSGKVKSFPEVGSHDQLPTCLICHISPPG